MTIAANAAAASDDDGSDIIHGFETGKTSAVFMSTIGDQPGNILSKRITHKALPPIEALKPIPLGM